LNRKIVLIAILAVYGIALFVLLTVSRMPIERIIEGKLEDAAKGRLSLRMNDFDLAFPDRVQMSDILFRMVTAKAVMAGRIHELALRPDYSGLFRGYLPARFKGLTPAGTIQGDLGVSLWKGSRDGYMSLRTERFSLEKSPSLQSALDRGVKGVLSGDMEVQGDLGRPLEARGEGRIHIADGAVEARLGLPGLDEIPFASLDILFVLDQGVLDLTQAEMKGPAFSGRFKGEIRLRKNLARSPISLSGELEPGTLVLENAFLSPLLGKVLKGDRTVNVRVGGTLERPTITRRRD